MNNFYSLKFVRTPKPFFIFLLPFTFYVLPFTLHSQSVGIYGRTSLGVNNSGTFGNPSSVFDISSTTGGLLIPRMTTAQRDAIATPAVSLLIYNTDVNEYQFFNGSGFSTVAAGPGSWTKSGGNVYLTTTTDKVGIGITVPGTKLWVQDNNECTVVSAVATNATGPMGFGSIRSRGTLAAPLAVQAGDQLGAFTFSGYDGAVLGTPTAGMLAAASENYTGTNKGTQLIFATTAIGTTTLQGRMTIDDIGKVGIGTTNPFSKLQIHDGGNSALSITTDANLGSPNDIELIFQSDRDGASNPATIGQFNDGALRFSGQANLVTPDMIINDAGQVGINNTSPNRMGIATDRTLTIESTTGANVEMMRITSGAGDDIGSLNFNRIAAPNGAITARSCIIGETVNGTTDSRLGFYTMGTPASLTERLRITEAGDVGIGSAITPNTRLDVKGSGSTNATFGFGVRNSSDVYSLVVADDGNVGIGTVGFFAAPQMPLHLHSAVNNFHAIRLTAENTTKYWDICKRGDTYPQPDNFVIGFWNGALWQEGFQITPEGYIGIGNNSPAEALDVNGRIRISQLAAPGSTADKLYNVAGNLFWNGVQLDAGSGWSLLGNGGTVDGTNFIGTTDDIPFNIRVNNQKAGRIESDSYVGNNRENTFYGYQAGNSNTTGYQNTGSGIFSLYSNTSGFGNAALGIISLYNNTIGEVNTASGMAALYSNTSGSSNTATGGGSLYSNTTGNYNTSSGINSLYSNVAGSNATAIGYNAMYFANNSAIAFTNYNVAVGYEALRGSVTPANNFGNANTALGYQTLLNNSSGGSNSAIGYRALYANTTGTENTANGWGALTSNTTASYNSAFGTQALYLNTLGAENTAIGYQSLSSNTTGSQNTAVGWGSLFSQSFNNGGSAWSANNTAIGYEALYSNQPTATNNGVFNTAVGNFSLRSNTTGASNTANGYRTLYNNTDGYSNAAFGVNALELNTRGFWNIAMGEGALKNNSTASRNVAIGNQALFSQSFSSGGVPWNSNNVAVGSRALYFNQPNDVTMGIQNTAVGTEAMYFNTSGRFNTALGFRALYSFNDPAKGDNTAIGNEALYDNISGGANTATGDFALHSNTSGDWNTATGTFAGDFITTGNGNTFIGFDADATSNSINKSTAIGYNAKVDASNAMVLGGTGADAVNVGIGTTLPLATLDITRDGGTVLFPRKSTAGDPGSPLNGMIYYNQNTNKFRVFENGTWVDMVAGAASPVWVRSAPNVYLNTLTDNVGIGLTTPAAKLDVHPDASYTGMFAQFQNDNNTNGNSILQVITNGNGNAINVSQTGFGLGLNIDATNASSSTTAAKISSSGNSSKSLEVLHVGTSGGSTDYGVFSTNTGAGNNNIGGYFSASGATNNYSGIFDQGNVGIGTTSPSQKLELRDGNMLLSNGAIAGELRFAEPGSTNYTAFKAGAQATDLTYTLPASITAGNFLTTDGSGNLSWGSTSSSAWGLSGNTGTVGGTNFIGTTDAQTFDIRTANIIRLRVANGDQVLAYGAGSAGAPFYSWNSDANTGLFNSAADQISVSTGGTERFRYTNAGQVQSAKAPSSLSPDYSFTGNSSTGMYSNGVNTLNFATNGVEALRITNTGQLYTSKAPNALAPDYSFTGNTSTGMYSNGANTLNFATNGVEALKITGNGQLQTGKAPNALSPDYSFTGNTSTGMYSNGANTLNFSTNGTERMKISNAGVVNIANLVGPGYVQADGTGNLSVAALPSGATAWITSGTSIMNNNASYTNVGINSSGSAPAAGNKLEIIQPATSAGSAGVYSSHTGAVTGTGYAGYFTKTGASTTNVGGYFNASGATNNYSAVFDQGNVGIGTTSPSRKLHVVQTGSSDALSVSTNGTGTVIDAVQSGTSGNAGMFQITNASNASHGLVSTTGGNGDAGSFQINQPAATGNAVYGSTIGTGKAARFENTNASAVGGNRYGVYSTATGTNSGTNIGGYFSASGAAVNNYAAVFDQGNVGIGITTPALKLHVVENAATSAAQITQNGVGNALTAFQTGTGRAGYFYINNTASTNDAIYALNEGVGKAGNFSNINGTAAAGSRYGVFSTATGANTGTNVAGYFSASGATNNYSGIFDLGLVGIGTTAPSYKLDVVGPLGAIAKFSNADYVSGIGFGVDYVGSEAGLVSFDGVGHTIAAIDRSDATKFYYGDYDLNVVGGNVGIGTTSPGVVLDVVNLTYPNAPTIRSQGAGNPAVNITRTNGTGGTLDLAITDGSPAWFTGGITSGDAIIKYGAGKSLKIGNNGGAPPQVTIDASGNVGIGTATTFAKLHINAASDGIRIQDGALSEGIILDKNMIRSGWTGTDLSISGSNNLQLQTYNGSWLTRMIILNGGNVGIGAANPTRKLQVNDGVSGGVAVYGENNIAAAADGIGVQGMAFNNAGYGIGGSFQGGFRGVYALANSAAGTTSHGVLGEAQGTGGLRIGVFGKATSANTSTNYALYGDASGGTGGNFGLWVNSGETKISDAAGLVPNRTQNGSIATSLNGAARIWFRTNNTNYFITNTGAGDYSEFFKTADTSLSVGEIVSLSTTGDNAVARANSKDQMLLGVVSKYGTGNNDDQEGMRRVNKGYVNIGMLGQLLVKVSDENGSISPGDPLTLSAKFPGVAVKAIESGKIIGYAMTHYPYVKGEEHYPTHTDAQGEKDCLGVPHVMALVQPTYWSVENSQQKLLDSQKTEIEKLKAENNTFRKDIEKIKMQLGIDVKSEK